MKIKPRHTLRGYLSGVLDWNMVTFEVDCPFRPDDPARDCWIEDSDECILQQWLEAAGPEGLDVQGPWDVELPATGVVGPPRENHPTMLLDPSRRR